MQEELEVNAAANRLQVGIDVALFAVTVGLAVLQRWSTTDLVWSLWISSLTVGYSLIVTSIIGSLAHGSTAALLSRQAAGPPAAPLRGQLPPGCAALPFDAFIVLVAVTFLDFSRIGLVVLVLALVSTALAVGGMVRSRPGLAFLPDPERGLARLAIMLPGAVFMLGFFMVHFGMFHFVHGLFLNGFFPLVRARPFGKTPDQVFGIVGACALSRVPSYAAAWNTTDGAMMLKPYLNVIRMHVMIFVFAFLSAAGLQSYALYPPLAVYFLPISVLLSPLCGKVRPAGPAVPSS